MDNKALILGISAFIAAIPVAIWIPLFFKQSGISKVTMAVLFFIGILTAPALLGIQYLWGIYPQFDVATLIESSIAKASLMYIVLFVFFGMLEEVIKHFAVRIIDKRTLAVKTLNDALRLSILAALGFSFAENIYYLSQLWNSLSAGELFGVYVFRSGFTMCAHMIFSGIFGYYFGISKFSIDITNQQKLIGKEDLIAKFISNLTNKPLAEGYKEKTILKGLLIAVTLHAIFNYMLQYNALIPVILFVIGGFLYLRFLLKRKVGHLVLLTDISEKKKSMFAKKDEDVVLELLGMWFKDKRYVDVLHICERLLERDPDNNVVKLFKAKATDQIEGGNAYQKILTAVLKDKDDLSTRDRSVIDKYLEKKTS